MIAEKTYDVIIVGGGFSGVTAFRDLRAAGRSVLLLEARERLGGRTWYRDFAQTQQKVEIGGTWTVDSRQRHVAQEKARYGIGTLESPTPINWRMLLDGKIRDTWLPVEKSEIAGLERGVYHLISDSLRIEVGTPYDQQGLEDLDVSFEAWMSARDVTGGTREFMSAFVGLNFGCSPEEVSALQLLAWIAGMGNSPWTMSTVLTNKFAGGTKALLDAMVGDGKEEICLSARVCSIKHDDDGAVVETESGKRLRAHCVVVATPLNTWKDISFSPALDPVKLAASQEGHTGHSVKPWVLVTGAPEHFASWAWGDGMCYLATEFEINEGSVMVGFAHSETVVDINDPTSVAENVAKILPDGAEVVAVDGHDWINDEFSQGTWAAFKPGQLTRFHTGLLEPMGRVVFAGSDVALEWPGWIEGAIQSGIAAARYASTVSRTC